MVSQACFRTGPSIKEKLSSIEKLGGWGRYPLISCALERPASFRALQEDLLKFSSGSTLARGLGRSYGDAALNNESLISTESLNCILDFDLETGTLVCQPGLSFKELIEVFLPRGWFAPVSPGTKFVTMGGAIAADIHGKNHHKDGSFVNCLQSFQLLTAKGELLDCSRQANPELFFASSGGMGLTGIISQLKLRLRKVETAFLMVKRLSCPDLSQTMSLLEANESEYDYSVCWIDCLSSGKNLGRSLLILGRHAAKDELTEKASAAPFDVGSRKAVSVPFQMPSFLLNRYSVTAFNEVYYRLSSNPNEHLSHFDPFFYPLDSIHNWNRLYGASGFIQYQCVFPLEDSRAALEEILDLSARRGRASFLAVLKKFGRGQKYLSFPMPGYTLTLDMPVKAGIFEFVKELDAIVLKYAGRVYLAKDACLDEATFARMYDEELPAWLEIKRAIDPANKFCSALSRRLKLY